MNVLPANTHVLAGIHDELSLDGPHAVLLVLWEELVPGNHEGVHVGDGAAGRQDAVPALPTDDLAHFLYNNLHSLLELLYLLELKEACLDVVTSFMYRRRIL
jgi:hypothetical protein